MSKAVTDSSISRPGYDTNLAKYKEAIVNLENAKAEMRDVEDEVHRLGLPQGWLRCQ